MNIYVPCTTANLGVLFDKGGAALDAFYNEIDIVESDIFEMKITGKYMEIIPRNKENLVCMAISRYYLETGMKEKTYSISMKNGIPPSRGLGSSAACIAGGMYAANLLEGNTISKKDLIEMAALMEGHGDNVCAALTGGFSIYEKGNIRTIATDEPPAFILYVPKTESSTHTSRALLPEEYSEEDKSTALRLESKMIEALSRGDYEKAGSIMEKDVIHQPYRKNMIPYWDEVIESAHMAGVYGTALSGAGPTMISICNHGDTESILGNLRKSIDIRYGLNIMGCEINKTGIRVVDGGTYEQQGQDSINT